MKKLLLVIFSTITSLLMAQISTSVSPKYGCPNVTHDVSVSVTYTGTTIPFSYTITLNVKDDQGAVLKTYSGGGAGIASGSTTTYTIADVPFSGPMTCTVDGTVSVPAVSATVPVPPQNYIVQFPYTLTIAQVGADLNVTAPSNLDGYSVQYFLNADFGTVIDESADGIYTPTADGNYSAMGVSHVTSTADGAKSCTSANASNTVNVIISSIEESQNISISVYPNPVVSYVTIAAGVSTELSYELSDMNGAIVRTSSFKGVGNINAEDLKAGSYILTIKNQNEKIASYKLVK